jgi:pyruvate-formate lyase
MKKTEERLDRLERIAKLLVRAGLRARRELRQQDDKITIMIDAQIKNEERFAKLAEAQTELAESQAHTDRRLDALIDIVKESRNGKSR